MNGIEPLLSSPWAQALGWGLLHSLWQGALVALALAGTLALMRRSSAAARYTVTLAALAAMVVLPVMTAWETDTAAPMATVGEGRAAGEIPVSPIRDMTAVRMDTLESLTAAPREVIRPVLPWLLAGWLAGVALLSFYHLGGWLQARRLRHRATRPVAEAWEQAVLRLGRRLGIGRRVTVLESAAVSVPAVLGWLRPVILVPASALAGLSPQQLEAVLAHELAHVRRHDYLVNLLQTVVETLLFYHPAVWWVSRQVRVERENCCDDLAVAVCGDRLVYARALADLEGLRTVSPRLAVAADGSPLLARVRRLVGAPAQPARRLPAGLAGGFALALVTLWLAAPLARVTPRTAEASPLTNSVLQIDVGAEPRGVEASPDPLSAAALPVAPTSSPAADRPAASPTSGMWVAERRGKKVWLQMTMRSEKHHWSNSDDFPASDLIGLTAGPEARFELRRDAGSFLFDGRFDADGKGAGTFRFQGNPAYTREMAALGYQVEGDKLIQMAVHDISLGFIRGIHSLGYRDIPLQQLVAFRIHGVSPEFIRALQGMGYDDIPDEQLVSMRIHGVTPEGVRALADLGYRDIPVELLVSMWIHGATPAYVRDLADLGYHNVEPEQLVSMRIHGATPAYIREIAETGYEGIPAEDLVSMRIHGVDADFIRRKTRGGAKPSIEQLISDRIHGR
ncbi:MAG TPA: M56 family metallopeptidase [Thermoanaerobaculia bacterium]|nr:M56 family metallopeptidase [Thermoanaerobaculia bacterium]